MVDIKNEQQLRHAIEMMFFGYRAFTTGPDRILATLGLNRMHHRILYFVGRDPSLSVNDLLTVLDISKQALNAPLRQLLSMKLVLSTPAKHDGRVRELRLTAEGIRLEKRLTGTQLRQLRKVLSAAGVEASAGWFDVMSQLSQRS